MLFLLGGSNRLCQGSFRQESFGMVIQDAGALYTRDQVAFVIPDDETQQAQAVKAGYTVHTPMSMHLGAGSTSPECLS